MRRKARKPRKVAAYLLVQRSVSRAVARCHHVGTEVAAKPCVGVDGCVDGCVGSGCVVVVVGGGGVIGGCVAEVGCGADVHRTAPRVSVPHDEPGVEAQRAVDQGLSYYGIMEVRSYGGMEVGSYGGMEVWSYGGGVKGI